MATIEDKTIQGQTLPDMAIQTGGGLECIFAISLKNGLALTDELKPGQTVEYAETTDADIAHYYASKNIHPATDTSLILGGIGFMGIQINFIVS